MYKRIPCLPASPHSCAFYVYVLDFPPLFRLALFSVDRTACCYVLFFHPSLLVESAFNVSCTIPIIPASLLYSISRLYEQRAFPVLATHLFFCAIFIWHGVQLAVYPFFWIFKSYSLCFLFRPTSRSLFHANSSSEHCKHSTSPSAS